MSRIIPFAYGALCYALFFATFVYTAGFLTNLFVPKSIDSGTPGPVGTALAVNLALLALFAIQHSGMARPAFKRVWTLIVPEPIERATYVLFSTLVLIAVMAFWQPIGGSVWHFESGLAHGIALAAFVIGLGLVLYSTMLIDHFELFGVRQVFDALLGRPQRSDAFVTPSLYAYVRHPLYVGWFIVLWATPSMTTGHCLLSTVCTVYILVAVQLEERDLVAAFGRHYRKYQKTTPMFLPVVLRPRTRRVDAGAARSLTA